MRRTIVLTLTALLAIASVTGCAKKQTAADNTLSSDSLLATSPVEQPPGSITPEQGMTPAPTTPDQQAPAEPTPAPRTPTHSAPKPTHTASHTPSHTPTPAHDTGIRVEEGTALNISVDAQISSETANVGDSWTGTLKDNVIVGDRVVFAAGSVVTGTITEAVPAQKGSLAKLGLAVTSITSNGNKVAVDAGTESIEAGSPRARNLGAIAGGAAAGALIGRAIGGGGKGALIGGLIGGAAAGGAVAKSKGYQVVLKEGTALTFNVKQPVTVHS